MSADLEKLLPCPFCGGGAVVSADMNSYPTIACDACGACSGSGDRPGVTAAIAAWNTRADNAALRAKAEWRGIASAPKDGTNVDLWGVNLLTHDKRQERIVNVAWGTVTDWMGREREDWKHGRGEDFKPTHWRPQPDPPEETP